MRKLRLHNWRNFDPSLGFKEARFIYAKHERPEEVNVAHDDMGNVLRELHNRISELESSPVIDNADEAGRLRDQYREAWRAHKERTAPIDSSEQLELAFVNLRDDELKLAWFDEDRIDHWQLDNFMEGEFGAFFDEQERLAAYDAFTLMSTRDSAQRVTIPPKEDIFKETQELWDAHIHEVENESRLLNSELEELRAVQDSGQMRQVELERMQWLEDYIPILDRAGSVENEMDWRHRRVLELEQQYRYQGFSGLMPDNIQKKGKRLVLNARRHRIEQVRKYLTVQYNELEGLWENTKSQFNEDTINEFEADLHEFKATVIDDAAASPQLLEQAGKNMLQTKAHLQKQFEALKEATDNPEAMKEKIMKKIALVEHQMERIEPHLETMKQAALAESIDQLKRVQGVVATDAELETMAKHSAIYKQHVEAIDAFAGGTMAANLIQFKSDLMKPGELSTEMLLTVSHDVDQLYKQLSGFDLGNAVGGSLDIKGMEDARKARAVIDQLKRTSDPGEIRQILADAFDEKQVQYVSDSDFDQYRAHTTSGFMVFGIKGDQWRVIINEDALKDPRNVNQFRKQLTHELLHLQFERDPKLNSQWLDLYKSNEQWPAIQAAFVSAFPTKKPARKRDGSALDGTEKEPYSVEDWHEDDIVSELFAMQDSLGYPVNPADQSKFGKLRNLINNAGIPAMAAGFNLEDEPERFLGYDDPTDEAAMTGALEESGSKPQPITSSPKANSQKLDTFDALIGDLLRSEYISYLPGSAGLLGSMRSFLDRTRKLNEKLHEVPTVYLGNTVDGRITQLEADLKELQGNMASVGEDVPNKYMNPLLDLWNNTKFVSISDGLQVLVNVKEFIERSHNRNKEDNAASLGMALFQNTTLGREARARAEKAEKDEVGEWENRYETLSAQDLIDVLHSIAVSWAPNKDQLKAVLHLLAKKGRLDWGSEDLWICINKLQNKVHLSPDDEIIKKNLSYRREKLYIGISEIWDSDEFMQLERDQESNYESGKEKFNPILDKVQNELTSRLNQILAAHRAGKVVDPHEYEGILEYSIKNGKSYAEHIFFHMMVGMADGILPPDRGIVLNKHLNIWPALEWFVEGNTPRTQAEWKAACEANFGEEYKDGNTGRRFKAFFWTEVQNAPRVLDRVRKSVSERNWDHDWGRTVASLGDASTARRYLQGKAGQDEAKATGISNFFAGVSMFLEYNSEEPGRGVNIVEGLKRQLGALVMTNAVLDNVAFIGSNYSRAEDIDRTVPREAEHTRHNGMTTGQFRKNLAKVVKLFDADLFTMLEDVNQAQMDKRNKTTVLVDKVKTHLATTYGSAASEIVNKVVELDQLFMSIGEIVNMAVDKAVADGRLGSILDQIKTIN